VAAPHGVVFTQVTAGNAHTCAIAGSRTYCWGLRNDQENGEVTPEGQTTPAEITFP